MELTWPRWLPFDAIWVAEMPESAEFELGDFAILALNECCQSDCTHPHLDRKQEQVHLHR